MAAIADDRFRITLLEVDTGAYRHILIGHTAAIITIIYSPRGDQIATGSQDTTIRLWDVETGDCRHTLTGHTKGISVVAYSPNGTQVASGSFNGTIRLWDVQTGVCRNTLKGHDGNVPSVLYSPRGDQIASGSHDGTDAESGTCIHTLNHEDYVLSVDYSPKGDMVASSSFDKTVRVWDAGTGDCCQILTGHIDFVKSVKFSPNGTMIASNSWDKSVRLWDVASGHCRAVIDFSGHITSIDWIPSSDTHRFVIGYEDGSARMWEVVEDGGGVCRVRLCWSTRNDVLAVKDASIQDVRGLSQVNRKLLKQRGAIGEPLPGLQAQTAVVKWSDTGFLHRDQFFC